MYAWLKDLFSHHNALENEPFSLGSGNRSFSYSCAVVMNPFPDESQRARQHVVSSISTQTESGTRNPRQGRAESSICEHWVGCSTVHTGIPAVPSWLRHFEEASLANRDQGWPFNLVNSNAICHPCQMNTAVCTHQEYERGALTNQSHKAAANTQRCASTKFLFQLMNSPVPPWAVLTPLTQKTSLPNCDGSACSHRCLTVLCVHLRSAS